jgi:hypothetical protein
MRGSRRTKRNAPTATIDTLLGIVTFSEIRRFEVLDPGADQRHGAGVGERPNELAVGPIDFAHQLSDVAAGCDGELAAAPIGIKPR